MNNKKLLTTEEFKNMEWDAPITDEDAIANIVSKMYSINMKDFMALPKNKKWTSEPMSTLARNGMSRSLYSKWENGTLTFAELHKECEDICKSTFTGNPSAEAERKGCNKLYSINSALSKISPIYLPKQDQKS